jgi:hypothetical protein
MRLLIGWIVTCVLVGGCASELKPSIKLTSPSNLCGDPDLDSKDFCLPTARLERLLHDGAIDIQHTSKAGHSTSGVKVLYVTFPEEKITIRAKWKPAPHGGEALNNTPRKELAAYEVQKLFLDADDYVVPPSVGRCIPSELHAMQIGGEKKTFDGSDCVFGVLTYWVENLTDDHVFDKRRFNRDPAYRKTIANMNLLTYLIDHRDTRRANFMISKDDDRPRAMVVDNGLAFSGMRNPIASFLPKKDWSRLIVPALPREQIDRLRRVTRADLDKLSVVSQLVIDGGQIDEVTPAASFDAHKGVRRAGNVIQIGLTNSEIDGIERRLKELLQRVDKGEVTLF